MSDYDLPPIVTEYLSRSRNILKDSIDLIEEVRTLKEIEQKEKTKKIELCTILEKEITEKEDIFRSNNIELECKKEEFKVIGGPFLGDLFSNILENSVNHAECELVRILIEESGKKIVCIIEDDGKGIPDSEKERIFEKEEVDKIPDYTEKLNNSGKSLDQFKEDTEEFQRLLEKCKSVLFPENLSGLGLDIDLPDIPQIDFPNFDFSGISDSIENIVSQGKIVAQQLENLKNQMEDQLKLEIQGIANFLKEFELASKIDDVTDVLSEGLTPIVSQVKSYSSCAKMLGCSDVIDKIDQANSSIQILSGKVEPEIENIKNNPDQPTPKYKPNKDVLWVNCSGAQKNNLQKATDTFEESMAKGRKKFSRIKRRPKHRATTIV